MVIDDKTAIVAFSGGLDSTYLVWKLLQERNVTVVYYLAGQGGVKIMMELGTIHRMVDILNGMSRRGEIKGFVNNVLVIRTHHWACVNHVPENSCQVQALNWVTGFIPYLSPRYHSYNVAYGADDIQKHPELTEYTEAFFEHMQNAYNSLIEISAEFRLVKDRRDRHVPPMLFPLRNTTKAQMLKELPGELVHLYWKCEAPLVRRLDTGVVSGSQLNRVMGSFIQTNPMRLGHHPFTAVSCGGCATCQSEIAYMTELGDIMAPYTHPEPVQFPDIKRFDELMKSSDMIFRTSAFDLLFSKPETITDLATA